MGIVVRSTINLPGLPAGRTANVDPSKPYIARCLAAGYLVDLFPEENSGHETDSEAVPVYGPVLEEGPEEAGPHGDSTEEGDEPDGPATVGEVL